MTNAPPTHKGEKLPPEPLTADMLAIIRRDDGRIPASVKLADTSRVLWDRHCLLAEVEWLQLRLIAAREWLEEPPLEGLGVAVDKALDELGAVHGP